MPEGHLGQVKDRGEAEPSWVELKDLVYAGLLLPGQMLRGRAGDHGGTQATVLPDGRLQVGEGEFTSPSGAAHHVRKRATNGWLFWMLDDGRRAPNGEWENGDLRGVPPAPSGVAAY